MRIRRRTRGGSWFVSSKGLVMRRAEIEAAPKLGLIDLALEEFRRSQQVQISLADRLRVLALVLGLFNRCVEWSIGMRFSHLQGARQANERVAPVVEAVVQNEAP